MRINPISKSMQSFGSKSIENFIRYNLDKAMSVSIIFPKTIDRTTRKLCKRFPEYTEFIRNNRESALFILPMLKEESKNLSLMQRFYTYLVRLPKEFKKSYKKSLL